jgi:RNA polymerase subunit RPABC4/transcription elongation factor Spt4
MTKERTEKKKYCPDCGSSQETYKFDGGMFEDLPVRYACGKCKILFSRERPSEGAEYL